MFFPRKKKNNKIVTRTTRDTQENIWMDIVCIKVNAFYVVDIDM